MEKYDKDMIRPEGEERKQNGKKIFIISVVCFVCALLLGMCIFALSNNSAKKYVIYLRENKLVCAEAYGEVAFVITEYGAEEGNGSPFDSADCIMTKSDKRFFFPQKYSENGSTFTLSYVELVGKDRTPKKVAFNISDYVVDNSGNVIIYIDKNGDMYEHNLEENTKELLFSSASDIIAATDDLNSCFYSAKGELYVRNKGEESLKLTGNRGGFVIRIYSSGEVYYIKNEATEHGMSSNLYFFDGEREFLVDRDVSDLSTGYSTAVDTPAITYRNKDKMTCAAICGETLENTESISAMEAYFSEDGKSLLICDKTKRYKASVKGGKLGEMTPIADGINVGNAFFADEKKLVYSLGNDLYINGGKVSSGVIMEEHFKCPVYYGEHNALLYFTEENESLYIYDTEHGKKNKVADNVEDYVFVDDDRQVYLTEDGGLIARNKKKTNRIDGDVSSIIAVSGADETFVGSMDKYTIFK